jgi:hypothetical protein
VKPRYDVVNNLGAIDEAGIDPIAEKRKAAGVPAFREAAALVHAEHKRGWKNGKNEAQWLSSMEAYAFPAIGGFSVAIIDAPAVRDLPAQIWLQRSRKPRGGCGNAFAR